MKEVTNFNELQNALESIEKNIVVKGAILCTYSFVLPQNGTISGVPGKVSMLSFNSGDGIGLTANNAVKDLIIQTGAGYRAIYTTISKEDLGTFTLTNLVVTGQIQFISRIGTMKSVLHADNIDIVACDSRRYVEQPQKYGVNVLQGAFTVYNFNGDADSVLKATVTNVSIGRKNAPVSGSGLFISGFGDQGGFVEADLVSTNEIYTNGMLPYGIADIITGGVFIVYGVKAEKVVNNSSVTTYGTNDMVLDNWGYVKSWTCEKPILSYGPSGIGFVNFGTVDYFEAKDVIETYGLGARGFNQYDGTVGEAVFNAITTHNDGSIGIQISKPVGSLKVVNSVTTHGAVGASLVKGVITSLPAYALSVKAGGEIKRLAIDKDLAANGDNVTTLDVEGKIDTIKISGKVISNGQNADAIVLHNGIELNTKDLIVESKSGNKIISK